MIPETDSPPHRGLAAVLFPAEPRPLRGRRAIKISLRALHVLAVSVFVGSHVLAVDPPRRLPWLTATIVSGLLILLLDLHESGVFLVQVRGLIVLVKVALLFSLPSFGTYSAAVLVILLLISVVSSHAPGSFRYRVVLGKGRIRGAQTPG